MNNVSNLLLKVEILEKKNAMLHNALTNIIMTLNNLPQEHLVKIKGVLNNAESALNETQSATFDLTDLNNTFHM